MNPFTNNENNTTPGKNSAPNMDDAEYEYVPLPSQGIFYQGPWKGKKEILVRKLNWEDEDILTTDSFYKNGTLFNELLRRTIMDDSGIKANDLVLSDRDAILWWLRVTAFGTDYVVVKQCVNCGHEHEVIWDMSKFQTPDLPEGYEKELEQFGCITIELPVSKLSIKISNPTFGKQDRIYKQLSTLKEKEKKAQDFGVTGKLLSVIVEAIDKDGKVYYASKNEIKDWLDKTKISIVDSRFIRKAAEKITMTVDTRIDITCPKCKYTEEGVRMPMSPTFFWPELGGL